MIHLLHGPGWSRPNLLQAWLIYLLGLILDWALAHEEKQAQAQPISKTYTSFIFIWRSRPLSVCRPNPGPFKIRPHIQLSPDTLKKPKCRPIPLGLGSCSAVQAHEHRYSKLAKQDMPRHSYKISRLWSFMTKWMWSLSNLAVRVVHRAMEITGTFDCFQMLNPNSLRQGLGKLSEGL